MPFLRVFSSWSLALSLYTHETLINHLISSGVLYSPSLIEAFRKCNRALFVPEGMHTDIYGDYPLSIEMGQTIS